MKIYENLSTQIFKLFSLWIWKDVWRTHHIVTSLKNYKNVTEQMMSNSVLAQIFLTLWTLNLGAVSQSAVWIICM